MRCTKISLDTSRELVLLAHVVPGGAYFVLNGFGSQTGNLAVFIWSLRYSRAAFAYISCSAVQDSAFLSLGRLK